VAAERVAAEELAAVGAGAGNRRDGEIQKWREAVCRE